MMCSSIYSIFLIFTIPFVTKFHVSADINEDLIVETSIGSIRGLRAEDGNYTMFLGIPFAKINESNIFGESLPQEPFDEIFEAFNESTRCPQVEEFNSTAVGSLDCLQLNVYVPDLASSQNLLPIMVYIYGGGFEYGFSDRFGLGPKYLVQKDIILVTFNYRLGPYGFMCLHTPDIPGNSGLKDQVIALRWVQNHIQSFGGDPNQVTVFGNSAGGVSIGLHLASENEKLFHNAIIQSAPVFSNFVATFSDNSDAVLELAKALNFETNNVTEALFNIASVDALKIVQTVKENGIYFPICVERQFPRVERFLSKHPLAANYSKVDGTAIMVGYNSDETLYYFNSLNWYGFGPAFSNNVYSDFNFDNDTLYDELSDMIRRFYLGDADAEINDDVKQQMMAYLNDFTVIYPTIRIIEPFLKAGAAKVYQYLFSYDGGRNLAKTLHGITIPGAAHTDELGYLFEIGILHEPILEDQLIIDRMTTMWTNFAKYRDPTPETSPLLPVTWQPIVNTSAYHYIDINLEMSSKMRYEHQRMTFWDLFYKAYGQYERALMVTDSATSLFFHQFLLFIALIINLL